MNLSAGIGFSLNWAFRSQHSWSWTVNRYYPSACSISKWEEFRKSPRNFWESTVADMSTILNLYYG